MKSLGKHLIFILIASLSTGTVSYAQTIWSTVSANKKSVYIGEPVKVSIKVFTTTWFTAGIDPGNIQVDGAYTVFFRNISMSTKRDGKTVAGVEMIINVFPNSDEDIEFPVLEIEVQSPKEGDYKGRPHSVKTKSIHIGVKPIPPGFDENQWLVTSNLTVNENWKGNLKNVKVGDVLERTISRDAANTVSQLLPPVAWDSISGISQYPALSNTRDERGRSAISAKRTETMRYLFEKEGEVIIPEMVLSWWNPYQQRLYKRTLKAVNIVVQPNPDLGMLATIKDSLATKIPEITQGSGESAPRTILGMSIKKFLSLVCVLTLLGIGLVYLIKWVLQYRKNYLIRYSNSELFYWRKFKRAVVSNNRNAICESAYQWIDCLNLHEPSLTYFAKQHGDESFISEAIQIEKSLGNPETSVRIDIKKWMIARKQYLQKPLNTVQTGWINPTI